MRSSKKSFKRVMALLLSVLMVFANLNVFVTAESHQAELFDVTDDGKWRGTTGGLVAQNYELNDYEKAILSCSGLVGSTYAVEIPTDSTTGLVSVDADAETVTANPYAVDGFVWVPTAAVIKYTNTDGTAGTDISVTLKKVGEAYVGNFNKPANSYRVEVTYSLYIPEEASTQELLLNTPYYLVDGYMKLNSAVEGSLAMAVSAINEKIEELRTLYNGIKYEAVVEDKVVYSCVLELADGKAKTAIGNLIADYDKAENGGRLTLAKNFADYTAATSKVQFMLENGGQIKSNIKWFYTQLADINAGSQDLLDLADKIDALATGEGEGSIAEAKKIIATEADTALQNTIIAPAVNMAKDDYNIDIKSLNFKTRKNDAIYKEIDAKRIQFNDVADKLDSTAEMYELLGEIEEAQKFRADAEAVRTTGLGALDKLEATIRAFYTEVDNTIAKMDAMAGTATEKADDIRNIVTGGNGGISLRQVVNTVRDYNTATWAFLGKKLVKDDVTAEEYAELDVAVKAAIDSYGDPLVEQREDFEIKAELLAHETVISAMVDQFAVRVEAKANVVSKGAIGTTSLVSLDVLTAVIPMDKGSDADSILAAITASNVESSALSAWDTYYNINTDKYNRTVTITDADGKIIDELGELKGDINYTISYTPKTFKITETYKADGEKVTEVPYGYSWRLPKPADTTKSYDYEVNGVSYRENTVIRVIEDVEVKRSEGKAIEAKNLAEVVAISFVPGADLSEQERAVLKTNAFVVDSIYFRTPATADKLTEVSATESGYLLEAFPMSAGLTTDSEAEWVPVSAYPVIPGKSGTSFNLVKDGDKYVGEFTCDQLFTSVQVVYELKISVIDEALLNDLANLADGLVKDVEDQESTLDALCTENNFFNNLARVDAKTLGSLGSLVELTPPAKAALKALTENCMDSETGLTKLYEYLKKYMDKDNGGIAYYYKADNAAKIIEQIELVNEYLPTIWNDQPLQDYINDYPEYAGALDRVVSVIDQLKTVELKPVNKYVDTNSAYIDNLIATVKAAKGNTSAHDVSDVVTMQQTVSAAAPGLSSYSVEIQVLNKNNGIVETYKTEEFAAQGNTITVADFEAMFNELLLSIPNSKYYVVNKVLPEKDETLGKNGLNYISTLTPVAYTVKINGYEDQVLYAFDAYTITLPGTGVSGTKYQYSIGGSTVEVFTGALENFSLAITVEQMDSLFGADRELVITRKLVDVNKDNLLSFIGKLNNAFANSGLTFDNNLAIAFIPVEDAEGNLSVVLRINSNVTGLSPASLAAEMMSLITDISYVGINGSPFFGLNSENELKIYLQTVINMLVNSGIGLDTLVEIVDENGDIKEMQLNGSAVNSNNNVIVLDNGSVINAVDALGGKLMESTLQFGVNVNNATSVPFYVTYQDFDTQADVLKLARKGAAQIVPYLNVSGRDGALNITFNAPDSVYAYLISAMLITGQVDIDTIQSYDLAKVIEYQFDLIAPMFENEGVSADSFINTIKQTGFFDAVSERFDIEAHKALMNFLYNSVDHFYDCTSATGSSEGSLYKGTLTYDALDVLLNSKISLGDYSSMIAEKDSEIALPITLRLKNRETNYEALVLDIRADGITNKYSMSRNVADAIKNAKDDAIIIMLSDVRRNITVNNDVFINLNGYTINGNLTAKGRTTIVDSTLATDKCGSITGKLTVDGGSLKIGGGKFTKDAEAYLEDGYYLNNGVVTNGCFKITEEGENLNIYLGTDYLSLDKSAAKVMATDVIFKLLMNYYTCSELVVDNNVLYAVDLKNITESLNNLSGLINKIVECVNCESSTKFATKFMNDVTNFGALANAIDDGTALVTYAVQHAAFNPYVDYVGGEDDFFTFNLSATQEKKRSVISVFLADDVPAPHRNKISSILKELDDVTTFDELEVSIDDVSYNSGFSFEGSAKADVTVDLSRNINYPVIIAAILAADSKGAEKTAYVNAIKTYQTTNSATELMKVIEKTPASKYLSALATTKSMSLANILKSLKISAPQAVELESLYTIARKVAGTVVDALEIDGPNATLAGAKVAGEYGTYSYELKKSADTYAKMTLKLFTNEKAIIVKDKNGVIYINTDNLAEALTSVTADSTVYINNKVTLAEDVILPAVAFKLVNADNITFGVNMLWFNNVNTVLTVDKDLTANIITNEDEFCSKVEYTKSGEWFVFRLVGEQHKWVVIPAVAPGCETEGSTEGIWCEYCHKYQEGKEPQPVDPIGHNYQAVVTPPTCTEQGYTTYTCSNCGDSYVTDYTNPTNHEGTTEIIPGKKATCTEDGLTDGLICTACNTVITEQTVIDAHHTPEDYEVAPNCTEPGITGATKCSVCDEILEAGTVVFPTGHSATIIEGKPATCTEDGLTAGSYCPVEGCGYVHVAQQVIPALGHDIVEDEGKDASCTEPGLTAGSYCKRCGEVFAKQEYIPVKDHTVVIDPAVEPTTDKTGLTEGSHCDVCGKVLVAQTERAKLPFIHIPEVKVDAVDGTIRGAKVDVDNKNIFIDVNPDGFTAKEFVDVTFKTENATVVEQSITNYNGAVVRGDDDRICTGDIVTLVAKNADGVEVMVTYNIIVMGDANRDGKINSRDLVLMKLAYVGDVSLENTSFLAGDMNFDGKINSRDTVACEIKYVVWSENGYISQLK